MISISKLSKNQSVWYKWFMEKEYDYILSFTSPVKAYLEEEAWEEYRCLIRYIEQAYTGHKHWERDSIDFRTIFDYNRNGTWSASLLFIKGNRITSLESFEYAIDKVTTTKYPDFQNKIKVYEVVDQPSLCMKLVEKIKDFDGIYYKYLIKIGTLKTMFNINLK